MVLMAYECEAKIRLRFERIDEIVDHWREAAPGRRAAIDFDGRELDWFAFSGLVGIAERELREAHVGAGHRVALIIENCVAAAAFFFACSRIGAWAVPINARLTAEEVKRILDHCRPQLVVATAAASADARAHGKVLGAVGAAHWRWDELAIAMPREATDCEAIADDPGERIAALIYTSGTTGNPKGVMLRQRGMLYVGEVTGSLRGMNADDLAYLALPLSHVFGLSSTLLGTLQAGGCVWFANRFDIDELVEALGEGVTVFQGVPAMYARLLAYADAGRPVPAPRLRYLSSGGSPLDLGWKSRIEALFGVPLGNGYGLTETSPTLAQTRLGEWRTDEAIGKPLPNIETRIVAEGSDARAGGVGELWVRGPTVFAGYYRDPATTAEAMTPDGWFKTGDLARRGDDGALFIVGRAKELIIRSGFNVYPAEVERALNEHEAVLQSAVVGRRIEGNEEVVAFVETRPGTTLGEAELGAFAADRLAPYKRPSRIIFLDALPASGTGKVLKSRLADLAASG